MYFRRDLHVHHTLGHVNPHPLITEEQVPYAQNQDVFVLILYCFPPSVPTSLDYKLPYLIRLRIDKVNSAGQTRIKRADHPYDVDGIFRVRHRNTDQ